MTSVYKFAETTDNQGHDLPLLRVATLLDEGGSIVAFNHRLTTVNQPSSGRVAVVTGQTTRLVVCSIDSNFDESSVEVLIESDPSEGQRLIDAVPLYDTGRAVLLGTTRLADGTEEHWVRLAGPGDSMSDQSIFLSGSWPVEDNAEELPGFARPSQDDHSVYRPLLLCGGRLGKSNLFAVIAFREQGTAERRQVSLSALLIDATSLRVHREVVMFNVQVYDNWGRPPIVRAWSVSDLEPYWHIGIAHDPPSDMVVGWTGDRVKIFGLRTDPPLQRLPSGRVQHSVFHSSCNPSSNRRIVDMALTGARVRTDHLRTYDPTEVEACVVLAEVPTDGSTVARGGLAELTSVRYHDFDSATDPTTGTTTTTTTPQVRTRIGQTEGRLRGGFNFLTGSHHFLAHQHFDWPGGLGETTRVLQLGGSGAVFKRADLDPLRAARGSRFVARGVLPNRFPPDDIGLCYDVSHNRLVMAGLRPSDDGTFDHEVVLRPQSLTSGGFAHLTEGGCAFIGDRYISRDRRLVRNLGRSPTIGQRFYEVNLEGAPPFLWVELVIDDKRPVPRTDSCQPRIEPADAAARFSTVTDLSGQATVRVPIDQNGLPNIFDVTGPVFAASGELVARSTVLYAQWQWTLLDLDDNDVTPWRDEVQPMRGGSQVLILQLDL